MWYNTEHGIEFPEKLWYEDLATTLKLSAYAMKIGYLKEVFYYYVQQPNSITHSTNTERMIETSILNNQYCRQYTDNAVKYKENWEEKMRKMSEINE